MLPIIVKLRTVGIIPESLITKGNSKQLEPINVFIITRLVLIVEFLGTKNKWFKILFILE